MFYQRMQRACPPTDSIYNLSPDPFRDLSALLVWSGSSDETSMCLSICWPISYVPPGLSAGPPAGSSATPTCKFSS
jgi:hypothetical protein